MHFYLSLASISAIAARISRILIGSLGATGYPFAVVFLVILVTIGYMIYIGKWGKDKHLGLSTAVMVLGITLGLTVII